MGKEDWKTMHLFGGGSLSNLWGDIGLEHLSEMWQGLEQDGRGDLGWSFHLNIPDSLGIWMPGAGMNLPPRQ